MYSEITTLVPPLGGEPLALHQQVAADTATTRRPRRRSRPAAAFVGLLAAALALTGTAAGSPQEPAVAPEQDAAVAEAAEGVVAKSERIIEGRVNPYAFKPVVSEGDEALREYLEALGEDAIEWFQHVQTLANPFFEGRAPGTRGNELTHEYVEFWFRRAGLEPAFPAEPESDAWTSYRQEWMLPGTSVEVRTAAVELDGRALERGSDFQVMGNSGSGTVTAPITFVGYAVEEGPDGYTSFAEGDDFTGRIVVMLRYEPINDEGKSRWAPRRFSEHAAMARKTAAVAKRNPAAIVLVNPPGAVDGREGLESAESSAFGRPLDVPFIQLSQEVADELLRAADPKGRGLADLRAAADEAEVLTVALREDRSLSIDVQVDPGGTKASNIGGVVRGKGSLADEWLIVGAHLDHVGYGQYGSQSANRGKLHPGADDNASGTAALLVLARRVSEWMHADDAPENARSVLFLAFDSEENGLRGSREYTRAPTLDLKSVQAMVNLDMVGRLRNDEMTIAGVGTAEGLLDRLRPMLDASGLTVHADPSGRGPSDHASFYNAGVPVLFLFTGSHDDYHTPSDRAHRVNPAGAIKVIALTESIVHDLVEQPVKLAFSEASRTVGRDRGYASVRLGIQPGVAEEGDEGVKVEAVSEGTSAAEAGILPGDVLIAWNGVGLENTRAMLESLQAHKPGDEVIVRVRRGDEVLDITVTLKASTGRRQRE